LLLDPLRTLLKYEIVLKVLYRVCDTNKKTLICIDSIESAHIKVLLPDGECAGLLISRVTTTLLVSYSP